MRVRPILARLEEATFAIRGDVDVVYGRSGLYRVGQAQRAGKADLIEEVSNWPVGRVQWDGSSRDLASAEAERAHAVNPVRILVGVNEQGSFYMPTARIISISLNDHAINVFKRFGFKADAATIRDIDRFVAPRTETFWKELSKENIRGTIAHELSHWIDDSLHERHIGIKLATAKERGSRGGVLLHVDQTPMELNAQVHAVADIRDQMGDAFDQMTWRDLLLQKPSLVYNLAYTETEERYLDVMRRFIKRLNREGLLGAGLRRIPSWKAMKAYAAGGAA